MKKLALGVTSLTLISAMALSSCSSNTDATNGSESSSELTGTVTVLLPNTTTPRFVEHDGPAFERAMAKLAPEVKVEIMNAGGDAAVQLTQIETAVNQGSKGLLLVAADPLVSTAGLVRASDAGIPVVTYQHEAMDGPINYHVAEDLFPVGAEQATYLRDNLPEADGPLQLVRVYGNAGDFHTTNNKNGQDSILDKMIESGEVEVVCEGNAAGWEPANAQQVVEQCLTKAQGNVDAVLVSNDGTAMGAVAALEGQGLEGAVPVYGGQDADIEALRYILEGKIASTIFKDYNVMAEVAAELMVAALTGEEPRDGLINDSWNNGYGEIPAAMFGGVSISRDNMDVIVESGLYAKEDLCEGITAEGFCS